MNKILIIIKREFLSRVRKKSFIILTFLGPFIFSALIALPNIIERLEKGQEKRIGVIEVDEFNNPVSDSLLFFENVIPDNKNLKFDYLQGTPPDQIKDMLDNTGYHAFIVLNQNLIKKKNAQVMIYTNKNLTMGDNQYISNALEKFIYDQKLLLLNIHPRTIYAIHTNIDVIVNKLGSNGFKEETKITEKIIIAYLGGFLIYMFVFFFSSQVMRGVVEEKSNRVYELIITSVRPLHLMLGKVSGIGMAGLAQFIIWVLLTAGIIQISSSTIIKQNLQEQIKQQESKNLFDNNTNANEAKDYTFQEQSENAENLFSFRKELNVPLIVILFLIYFIGGYLLYSSIYAAIGAAMSGDTDTQQFVLPISLPLIISLFVMTGVVSNPDGAIAFWFSMIPFTSPVVIMARIIFGIPIQELILSVVLLALTVIFFLYLSSRIYKSEAMLFNKRHKITDIIVDTFWAKKT